MSLRSIRTWLVRLSALTVWGGALMAAPILRWLGSDLARLAAMYGGYTEPPPVDPVAAWGWIGACLLGGLAAAVAELDGRGHWLVWLSHALSIVALSLCGAAWWAMYQRACG